MTKLQSFAIIGGGKKENRSENDFYPTPPECTHALLPYIPKTVKTIWEPACGDGAMVKVLSNSGYTVYGSDLRTEGIYGSVGIDFLKCNRFETPDAIITNPPFNLAEDFIRKALSVSPVVCMLLKSQYWHAAKRVNLFISHKPSYILPMTWRPDFSGGGNPTMDCIWTVWISGEHDAKYIPLIKPTIGGLF